MIVSVARADIRGTVTLAPRPRHASMDAAAAAQATTDQPGDETENVLVPSGNKKVKMGGKQSPFFKSSNCVKVC